MDFAALLRQAREVERAKVKIKAKAKADDALPTTTSPGAVWAADADTEPLDLARYEVLPDVAYVPCFVTEAQAQELETCVGQQPWVPLYGRRLQNYGGVPHPCGTIQEPLPEFLRALALKLARAGVFPANAEPDQALVNQYAADQGSELHFTCLALI